MWEAILGAFVCVLLAKGGALVCQYCFAGLWSGREHAKLSRRLRLLVAASLLLAAGGLRTAVADDPVPVSLGTLGGSNSAARGINDAGEIVGTSLTAYSGFHAFLYKGGVMHDLNTRDGGYSHARGINDAGHIVGWNDYGAFLYRGGVMHELADLVESPGLHPTAATAINNAGDIVGYGTVFGPYPTHAFLYSGGVMHDLGTLGGSASQARGINDVGQIVGSSSVADNSATHAFLYQGGSMRDLGTLGGSYSHAFGINNAGDIVGYSQVTGGAGTAHAFLYRGGSMRDLGTLGGSTSQAHGINDAGDIVGWSTVAGSSTFHAFLYRGGVMHDLGTLDGHDSSKAYAINDAGSIVGESYVGGAGTGGQAVLWNDCMGVEVYVPQIYQNALCSTQGDVISYPDDNGEFWNHDQYARRTEPDKRIGYLGCNITSLAMVLHSLGRYWGSDLQRIDPRNLNNWLLGHGGYNGNNDVIWEKVYEYTGGQVVFLGRGDGTADEIKRDFEAPMSIRSMARVRFDSRQDVQWQYGHHWAVPYRVCGSTVSVRDPATGDKTNDDYFRYSLGPIYVRYEGEFYHSLRFAAPGSLDLVAHISAHLACPAELVVEDPLGGRTGYDPETGARFDEAEGASYWQETLASIEEDAPDAGAVAEPTKWFYVRPPRDGDYRFNVIGTGTGRFTLGVTILNGLGEMESATVHGFTAEGLRAVYEVAYDESAGHGAIDILPVASAEDLADWVAAARDLGEIDNRGIERSLQAKLETAQKQSGHPGAVRGALAAFVHELAAQENKHITSHAVEVLTAQANAMMEALPQK